MRHDWNSILSEDYSLRMQDYSKEFFPHRSALHQYLNDYAEKFELNVKYNTEVHNITRAYNSSLDDYFYSMMDQIGNTYICR